MKLSIDHLLEFTNLIRNFVYVNRVTYLDKSKRLENDAEHSYHLAMLAWYIVDAEGLPYDKEKIFKYALAHDLVEVYAGDTFVYSKDKELVDSKHEREEKAAQKIKGEFPEFEELHSSIRAYEKRADEESRFVYALDKIVPVMHAYTEGGDLWKDYDVSFEQFTDFKVAKSTSHPVVKEYFEEIYALLKKHKDKLFPS